MKGLSVIHRRCLRLLPIVLMACGVLSPAADTRVPARIYVPIPQNDIDEVRLGGERISLKGTSSAMDSPVIVFVASWGEATSYGDRLVKDLAASLRAQLDRPNIEWWGTCGTAKGLVGENFREGWVLSPRQDGRASSVNPAKMPIQGFHRAFSWIASRYANRGPVRVVFVADWVVFNWLDGRSKPDSVYSPIEDQFETVGDSGFTLIPLLLVRTGRPLSKQLSWSSWGTSLLGGLTPTPLDGNTGASINRAIAESDKGTVLSVEMPAKAYTRRSFPRTLDIVGRNGKVIYSRPFVVSGRSTASDQVASGPDPGFCRLLPEARIEGPILARKCASEVAPSGTWFVMGQSDLSLCGGKPDCRAEVEVSVKYPAGSTQVEALRGGPATLIQQGSKVCIGPVRADTGAQIVIYSQKFGWLASIP